MQLLIKGLKITNKINEDWIKQNCYIAGGACVSNFTRKPINDVDIYFKTKEARDEFIKEVDDEECYFERKNPLFLAISLYDVEYGNDNSGIEKTYKFNIDSQEKEVKVSRNKSSNGDFFRTKYSNDREFKDVPVELYKKQKWMFENGYDYVLAEMNHYCCCSNAYIFGNKSITIKKNDMKYQFILRFYGNPEEMMDKTFDFQHCKIAYDLSKNEYIASQDTWQCLSKRKIKYVNSFYPISSLKRMYKYKKREFTCTNDEFVKIVRDIHKLDVNNKFVIEDQLVGYYEDFDYNVVFKGKKLFSDDSLLDEE